MRIMSKRVWPVGPNLKNKRRMMPRKKKVNEVVEEEDAVAEAVVVEDQDPPIRETTGDPSLLSMLDVSKVFNFCEFDLTCLIF